MREGEEFHGKGVEVEGTEGKQTGGEVREGEEFHGKGVEGEGTEGKQTRGEVREGEEIHEKRVVREKGTAGLVGKMRRGRSHKKGVEGEKGTAGLGGKMRRGGGSSWENGRRWKREEGTNEKVYKDESRGGDDGKKGRGGEGRDAVEGKREQVEE